MVPGRPGFNPWVGKIPWTRERLPTPIFWLGEFHRLCRLPWWLSSKESTHNAGVTGETGLILGSGRTPGEGHSNPPQFSCLENRMDTGAWWATVHGVTRSRTQLKRLSRHAPSVQVCLLLSCLDATQSRLSCFKQGGSFTGEENELRMEQGI